MVIGESVYGEKRIPVEDKVGDVVNKTEYRVWNAFRSKLAASILNCVSEIYIKPGAKVLYLGAASGTTVSHVSDIVGEVFNNFLKIDWNCLCSRILRKKWKRLNKYG